MRIPAIALVLITGCSGPQLNEAVEYMRMMNSLESPMQRDQRLGRDAAPANFPPVELPPETLPELVPLTLDEEVKESPDADEILHAAFPEIVPAKIPDPPKPFTWQRWLVIFGAAFCGVVLGVAIWFGVFKKRS